MLDYEPVDISSWCNAGPQALGEGGKALVGRQSFRGLPFLVGSDGDGSPGNCLLALDGDSEGMTIRIAKAARRVIFAHRLLQSELMRGGMVGKLVAEYVFHVSGADEVRVPVRERFEIGTVAADRFEPFLAVSDQNDLLLPRQRGWHEGWDLAGERQTEAVHSRAAAYLLWSWQNPHPGRMIESIEIVPRGPGFIIAGVTLGHLDEHPFVREGKRETRIVLADPKPLAKPADSALGGQRHRLALDLDVEVDRGIATYPQTLPEASADEFLSSEFKGFGEPQSTASSPAYVEIAAIPSATVTVRQDGVEVGKARWGDVETKGAVATPGVRLELADRGRNWVRVTVLDDDTNRPVACRVHFRSPDGIPYQPHGHHNHVNSNLDTWHVDVGGDVRLGQITYAYIDGTCEGWLPRGEVLVDVARGPEYEPLRTKVKIEPGQREVTLRIKRWIDMNRRGWYSGDSHVHFLSTQGSHIESQAEDLNVVNLLQAQWGSLFTSIEEFTGGPSISRKGDNIVYVSQENRQHFMGHMLLWGLKSPVMPWASDGPSEGELGGTMETVMSHWADRAHAQGGTVIIPHFPMPYGEQAALIATGRVDAVEMIRHERYNHSEYYRYLNGGYRVPLVAGTDKMSNDVPVGMYRTYAYMPQDQEFTYENWCKSVASGRTFASGGPMMDFKVDGRRVGDTVALSGPGTVEVEAWAESTLPLHSLQIVKQGRVVASTESRVGRRLSLKERIHVDGHTWLAARCGAADYFDPVQYYDIWSRGIFAHTSPIYVACGGEWGMFDSEVAEYMLTMIDGAMGYIGDVAARHSPGTVTHHHGEADHLAYLRRPFLEAQEAIRERMRR